MLPISNYFYLFRFRVFFCFLFEISMQIINFNLVCELLCVLTFYDDPQLIYSYWFWCLMSIYFVFYFNCDMVFGYLFLLSIIFVRFPSKKCEIPLSLHTLLRLTHYGLNDKVIQTQFSVCLHLDSHVEYIHQFIACLLVYLRLFNLIEESFSSSSQFFYSHKNI